MSDGRYNEGYQKRGTNPLTAGMVGAILGAGIGVGVAVLLTDPQKRRRVGKKVQDLQKWGNKTLHELRDKTLEAEEQVRDELLTTAADKAERVQKELDEAAQQAQKTK